MANAVQSGIVECDHGEIRGPRFCAMCRKVNQAIKVEAIEAVANHVNGMWWAAAQRAVKQIAMGNPTLTADDVLRLIESWGHRTTDNRALGPIMNDARAKGLIRASDRFKPSINKRKHQSPTRIWESLIYDGRLL